MRERVGFPWRPLLKGLVAGFKPSEDRGDETYRQTHTPCRLDSLATANTRHLILTALTCTPGTLTLQSQLILILLTLHPTPHPPRLTNPGKQNSHAKGKEERVRFPERASCRDSGE